MDVMPQYIKSKTQQENSNKKKSKSILRLGIIKTGT